MENWLLQLQKKLQDRAEEGALRSLKISPTDWVDFSSNDYLGFAQTLGGVSGSEKIGSGGSRLLAGNYTLIEELEAFIAQFHQAPKALVFNSGYVANLGVFSTLPQKGDTILYDSYIHASVKEGFRASLANFYAFPHNDVNALKLKLQKISSGNIFIAVESVYSMDGDLAPLSEIVELALQYNAIVVIDEAHALGVIGKDGKGLVNDLNLQNAPIIRVNTFGKALGCHGAAVLCNEIVHQYLINFCRPFIYSTSLSPQSVSHIFHNYKRLKNGENIAQLQQNIQYFNKLKSQYNLNFIPSSSAIQCWLVPGNENVKQKAKYLNQNNWDVKPVLSPTVPKGLERIRICLHSFNTTDQIKKLLEDIVVSN
jgi:8-amino-7-oxononanoate synthase